MKPIYGADGNPLVLFVGRCCREWIMAAGYPHGRCGYCGQVPEFVRWEPYDEEVE